MLLLLRSQESLRMLQKTLISTLLVLFNLAVYADSSPYFYKVKAKNGDGVYSILRKYDLLEYKCNIQKFYELNNINKNSHIIKGKNYLLPIKIYTYNGKSIRSTINIDDYDKAVRIKRYNEKLKAKRLRKKDYVSSKILWVPHHELECGTSTPISKAVDSKINSTKKLNINAHPKTAIDNLYIPLFGKEYANFKVEDRSLKGKVYYLVSGHGGPDPGARCTGCSSTLCEDEYAYDVVLRLARNLMKHGATVHVIIKDANDGIRDEPFLDCDKDELCLGTHKLPLNQKKRLKQRSDAINRLYNTYKKQGYKEQYSIFVHVDSRTESKRQDSYFYYYKHSRTSKALAKKMQSTFKAKYDKYQKGRGYKGFVKDRGLYVLRNTLPPAVYVELANIKNPDDQERLVKKTNRQALANWMFDGLKNFKK